MTSPPYYGLRDYGNDKQGGLEKELDCLAWARSEEPCDGCYICWVRKVAHELHRVLRDDGTLWWNIGDSYNGSGGSGGDYSKGGLKEGQPKYGPKRLASLKQKDLCMTPARTALALQADGWYLRQDIIWAKDSCMPESVKDRCTKAHEYIFLLTKQPKYYYDADAIREQHTTEMKTLTWDERKALGDTSDNRTVGKFNVIANGLPKGQHPNGRNKRSVWRVNPKPYKGAHFAVFPEELIEPCILAGVPMGGVVLDPFMGSGTTIACAINNGRRAIGIELNPEYIALTEERIGKRLAELGLKPDSDRAWI